MKPINDRVVVKPAPADTKTKGGIIICRTRIELWRGGLPHHARGWHFSYSLGRYSVYGIRFTVLLPKSN